MKMLGCLLIMAASLGFHASVTECCVFEDSNSNCVSWFTNCSCWIPTHCSSKYPFTVGSDMGKWSIDNDNSCMYINYAGCETTKAIAIIELRDNYMVLDCDCTIYSALEEFCNREYLSEVSDLDELSDDKTSDSTYAPPPPSFY